MEELDQLDVFNSDDESEAPAAHSKLLGAVSKLYEKKRVKAPTRKEPSLEVSEFHLSQPDKNRSSRVKVTDLAKVLNKRASHAEISQKVKNAQKRTKTLPKPLEKIHSDKITRVAGYEHAKRQLNRWDAIVYQHKVAENLRFPLKSETIKVQGPAETLKMFRKPTELELQMIELLKHPDPLAQQKEEEQETRNEENAEEYPLSLAEVIEKRKMMAKLRAQQSYRQAKAVRHSKIKSKKFHQIQRRARVKEQLREFEELQKKDPEAALKKLEELERTRAEERVTLRHRSTGKWAKNLAVRAKYDKDARIALAEQLSKSRELTVKLAQSKDSESEKEEEEEVKPGPAEEDPSNPWVIKRSKEMEEFISGYRKYWETKGKEIEKKLNGHTSEKLSVQGKSETSIEKESSTEESGKSISRQEKNNSDKENDQACLTSCNTDKSSNNENYIADNNSVVSSEKNKHCSFKNIFIVNELSVNNDNITIERDKIVSKFVCEPVKDNNVNMRGNFEKPIIPNSKSMKTKIKCKSGSWSVTKVPQKNMSNCKNPEMLKTFSKQKAAKSLGNSFKITESKNVLNGTGIKSGTAELSKADKRLEENSQKKEPDLDELFDEVEDKLENKIKEHVEKIKKSLDKKRSVEIESDKESGTEEVPSLELKKRKVFTDVDEALFEQHKKSVDQPSEPGERNNIAVTQAAASADVKSSDDIDPNKFLKVTPRQLCSKLPDIMTEGDDALDEEETTAENRHITISEAFAEDDIVDQFQKEKEDEVKKNTVADVDLTLPGWGSWAGHNMKPVSRRKRKKFVIKFPKVIPRRDTNRGNVIINEDADKPVSEHQVSDVPFPFTSVKEYEASIRTPLGSTWVPQTAHRTLILPPVITQLGAVIEPMDDSQLVNKDKKLPTNKGKKIKMK